MSTTMRLVLVLVLISGQFIKEPATVAREDSLRAIFEF